MRGKQGGEGGSDRGREEQKYIERESTFLFVNNNERFKICNMHIL